MIEIIPSILVKTREEMVEKITAVEPYVDSVHLDIADGIFVPNMTIMGLEEMDELDTKLRVGVHLMVSKPENHIGHWLETIADKFIFHIEATSKVQEVIDAVKEADKVVGLALNPQTPISKIEPFMDQVDFVHFMTVEPGFYGGRFLDPVIEKIKEFHFLYPDKPIETDGGVSPENALKLIEAGTEMLVVGSYIWDSQDVGQTVGQMKKITS